jgi:hypothetical protein
MGSGGGGVVAAVYLLHVASHRIWIWVERETEGRLTAFFRTFEGRGGEQKRNVLTEMPVTAALTGRPSSTLAPPPLPAFSHYFGNGQYSWIASSETSNGKDTWARPWWWLP